MAALIRKQDMPPPGGYKAIPYLRVPAKKYLNGKSIFGIIGFCSASGFYLYYLNTVKVAREEVEMRSSTLAMMPMLIAERDREYLKHLRRNREEERKLMANVPGWEVGTWYGEPIYKTVPKDKFVDPIIYEFYAHAELKAFRKRTEIGLWC